MKLRHGRKKPQVRGGKGGWEPRIRIRHRELRATRLEEEGWTQAEIARELHISQAAVSKLLRRVNDRLAKELMTRRLAEAARSARLLRHISREGRRAWETSKTGRIARHQRKTVSPDGSTSVVQTVRVIEQPDPSFLAIARDAERIMLSGLTPGKGTAMPDPPIAVELTDDERARRIMAILSHAQKRAERQQRKLAAAHDSDQRDSRDQPISSGRRRHGDVIGRFPIRLHEEKLSWQGRQPPVRFGCRGALAFTTACVSTAPRAPSGDGPCSAFRTAQIGPRA